MTIRDKCSTAARLFSIKMRTFDSLYTNEAVVDALIGIRLKSAGKRHDLHFFQNVALDAKNPEECKSEVDQLLPPRSQWFRPRANVRSRLGADAVARLSIRNATLRGLQSKDCHLPWVIALREFLIDLRGRAGNPSKVPLRRPEIFASAKGNRRKDEQVRYRVLTQFSYLPDRILIGQTAKYLVHLVDQLFLDCSHAFRVSRSCSRDMAVNRIQEYIISRKGNTIFAAECDIQKFFDCIDHDVARRAFDLAVERMAGKGHVVDPKAQSIFYMYLDVYDYFQLGLPAAQKYIEGSGNRVGHLDSPDPKLLRQLRGDKNLGHVGVPQGGALSPLIANLVLDGADRAVLGEEPDRELLYLRYCDDMIVLHTDESKCKAALHRYMAAIKKLLLPIHEPQTVPRYSREFYDSKSKQPYRIGDPGQDERAVPWVAFLGYQVHWDGALRVRKGSLDRHKHTQTELVQRVLTLISWPRARVRLNSRQIEWRVALRLVSAAIGRASLSCMTGGNQPCWMNAFRLLDQNVHSETQLRQLDRHRDRLLRKLKRAVKRLALSRPDSEMPPNIRKEKGSSQKHSFIGRPLSYYGRQIGDKPIDIHHNATRDRGSYGRDY